MTTSKVSIGSVSSGTLRHEDLIPAFLDCLGDLGDEGETSNGDNIADMLVEIESRSGFKGYYESDESEYDLESLFYSLNDFAPPYCYFGAHQGDGADFGFWPDWDAIEELDGLRVADTSEVPSGFTGEVLHVNDHGNTTLYVAERGELTEVWAIV